ncbi:MAG TPA: tryptophan--tRNA ligase [Candidatus Saccharimonadia bacterium]|nr:tryptophan--tRNA ligase [Candidatus Saccharimonadia bacterium]
MTTRRILTGITTTGSPHLGNYVGAIRPAIEASRAANAESFYFLADYHALVKCHDPARIQRSTLEIAATWLACGLDPDRVLFYRQSDVPEIAELTWLLTCVTGKGLLNRAHAYKAAVEQNAQAGEDPDAGVTAGLYMYPVLMAADILMFNAHEVPVGRDQVQHIEIARDVAQRFNHLYGREWFTLPEAKVDESTAVLPGLDGRKMSKSYDNTIPLWLPAKELRRAIMGIVTNSLEPNQPKDPDTSHLYAIYQAFADRADTSDYRRALESGIAWGDAKERLYQRLERELGEARARYDALIDEPERIEAVLANGAAKARARAQATMRELRTAVGLRSLSEGIRPRATGDAKKSEATPKFVTYRERDGTFWFKASDAAGEVRHVGGPYASPQDARAAMDRKREELGES